MTTSKQQIGRRRLLTAGAIGTGVAAAAVLGATPAGAAAAAAAGPSPVFTDEPGGSVVPYRAFDSRTWEVSQGGGRLLPGQVRTIQVDASLQGASADHVFLSVTVTATTGTGYLTVYPADRSDIPRTSMLNWKGSGQTVSAGLLIRCQVIAGSGLFHRSLVKVRFSGTGEIDVILDVTSTFGTRTI